MEPNRYNTEQFNKVIVLLQDPFEEDVTHFVGKYEPQNIKNMSKDLVSIPGFDIYREYRRRESYSSKGRMNLYFDMWNESLCRWVRFASKIDEKNTTFFKSDDLNINPSDLFISMPYHLLVRVKIDAPDVHLR